MKKTSFVVRTVSTSCLILVAACSQNAHVTRRNPPPGTGAAQTAAPTAPGTVSWAMVDANQQTCPKSGEGVILRKFVDQNGNGKQDADEAAVESKTVCSGAVGANGQVPTLPPTLLSISDATKDQCAEGGKVVEAYIDLLPNTKKDPQEPALMTGLVCNGDRGDGTKFTVTDAVTCKGALVAITSTTEGAPAPTPSTMTYCEGPTPVAAIMPKISRRDAIKSEKECKFGGDVLELYYDSDGNGRKDTLEFVASSVKLCKVDPASNVVIAVLSAEDRATIDQLKLSWAGVMQLKTHLDEQAKRVDELAGKAENSAKAAQGSADAAKASADAAKLSQDAAKLSEDASKLSQDAAAQSATAAQGSADAAKGSADAAKTSADAAKVSQDAAKVSEDAAKVSQDAALVSANAAAQSATDSKGSADAAKLSQDAAKLSEDAAKVAADASKGSADAAKISQDAAKVSQDAAKVSEDASKVSQDAAKGSEDASAKSATDAANLADQAQQFKTAAELARDAAAESAKAAEASKLAAEESMKAKLAEAQGLVEQAKAHRDAAELAAQASDEHRKAAEAAKDAALAVQTLLESTKTELQALHDLAIARADELAAALEILKNAPRTIDEATQKALADLTAEVEKLRTALSTDVDGHKTTLQGAVDAGVATLNAKKAELDEKAAKLHEDIDVKVASAKADAAKAAEDAAKAKDDAAAAIKAIADAMTTGTAEIDAKKKEIQDLVAPVAGQVDEVRRLAEEIRAIAQSLPEELKGYVAAAKKYFEEAEAARAQIPATIEDLQRKAKEAQENLQRIADQAQANSQQGVTQAVADIRAEFDALKTAVDASGTARDTATRQLLATLEADAKARLSSIEQKLGGMEGLQGSIDKVQTELDGRISKLEEAAANQPAPPPPSEQTCDVVRKLTDVTAIDKTTAAGLELPYDRQSVETRDYQSAGEAVPYTDGTLQIRRNRQELFQINTAGLPQLTASDLVEGSLKATLKLVVSKNMKDETPYDYTEILCSLGEKRACSGQRYQPGSNFDRFIVGSFWQSLAGKNVATPLFSDLLKAPNAARTALKDLPGPNGEKYKAFKQPLEIELGDAFKGQADVHSIIYGVDGQARKLLQFVVTDDVRLDDVSLTVSYKTKSCAQR